MSDITFGLFLDTSERNHSLSDGHQQRDDARLDQASEAIPRSEPPLDRPTHPAQREVLQRHPEWRVPFSQTTTDTPSGDENSALTNVPESNVLPTFLITAASESEPSGPKSLRQAKNDANWPESEKAMLEEVGSLKQKKS